MLTTLTGWFRPPTFPDDEDKARSALLLNVVLNTFLIALPVIIAGVFMGGSVPRATNNIIIVACAWLTIFGTRLIMLRGRVAAAGILTVIVIFSATTLAVYNVGTIRAPATVFYVMAIIISGLTISSRAIIWATGISAASIIGLLTAEINGRLPTPTLRVSISQGITFTVALTVIGILLYLAVKSIDEALARVRQELAIRQQAEAALQKFAARLGILHEIDRALLSSTSLHSIALGALIRIRQLIPCPRASVSLFDLRKNEAFFLAADLDGGGLVWDTPITLQEYGQHIIDELQQNKPMIINDVLTDPHAVPLDIQLAKEGIHSWLYLPLHYQGQLIGALNLGRGLGESFTPEDSEIAQDVANQLAIAIQQSRLYDALQNELTERQNLITQLEANNAELERFTYTVSHDLRNPLVTIKGFLGMLNKDIQENRPDRIQSDFQRIAGATDKMDALLTDLLELSRIGRIVNPPMEIDSVRLIQDAIDTVDARLRSKKVTVNIAPDIPPLYGDRTRLREVFENLIENAAKNMGNQPNPVIEIGTRDQTDEPVIFVKDNGIGIDPRYHTRIFNLFEKLNPAIEGTGIGLALVKRIIEVHDGKVWVESEGLGKGSTFCFTVSAVRK
ncbi:MAG: ATP-binding protein [Chloroflexota bacterium]